MSGVTNTINSTGGMSIFNANVNPTTSTTLNLGSLGATSGTLNMVQADGSSIVVHNHDVQGGSFTLGTVGGSTNGGGNNSVNGSEGQTMLDAFWPRVVRDLEQLQQTDFKQQELPLARIKKIMKLDDDVKSMVRNGSFVLFSF